MLCDPVCQKRVCMKEETSLSDTVGLVVEFLRHHFIEVSQLLILQDFCVQTGNTVYRVACCDCQMCHLHLSIIDDCHLFNLLIVARIFCLDFCDKAAVDFLDDLVYTRKQSGEQLDRPFLKCLGHDGMVGVGNGFGCDLPCFVPAKSLFVHEDTH